MIIEFFAFMAIAITLVSIMDQIKAGQVEYEEPK